MEAIKSCEISFRRGDSGGSGRSFFIFLGFSICIPVLAIYYNKIVQQNFVGSLLIKPPALLSLLPTCNPSALWQG